MVVPARRNVGVRALKDQQHFLPTERFPLRIGLRHVAVNGQPTSFGLGNFHGQVRSNGLFAIEGDKGGKVVLLEKFDDQFTVFFAVKFGNVHGIIFSVSTIRSLQVQ